MINPNETKSILLLVRTQSNFEGWLVMSSVLVCNCLGNVRHAKSREAGNLVPGFFFGKIWTFSKVKNLKTFTKQKFMCAIQIEDDSLSNDKT